MEYHPVANLFPWMDETDFQAIREDIQAYQGEIIDGGQSWR